MTTDNAASLAARDVDLPEAEGLVRSGSVHVLDVRTQKEFANLGHIPGAQLLPIDQLPLALDRVPRDGKPLLIVCEHGARSEAAVRFLARSGYRGLLNLRGGMAKWTAPRAWGEAP